jgi:hypothetical protein
MEILMLKAILLKELLQYAVYIKNWPVPDPDNKIYGSEIDYIVFTVRLPQ